MGKADKKDLLKFLAPYPGNVQELALMLREFVWDLYPGANELIDDNYNALAFGWSPTDRVGHSFCSVAVMPKYVHFGFYWGKFIFDPKKILLGKGNQYRYIIVNEPEDFPSTYIKKLVKEAYTYSLSLIKDKKQIIKGKTITKSISPVKNRPGRELKRKKRKR
ncbi:MAG: hypothetical protein ACHQET_07650 [Chitinophagales bacterium]